MQHRAGPGFNFWHDPQGPRSALMGLSGNQLNQAGFGVPWTHCKTENFEGRKGHSLDSTIRAQAINLREKHNAGGWFVVNV